MSRYDYWTVVRPPDGPAPDMAADGYGAGLARCDSLLLMKSKLKDFAGSWASPPAAAVMPCLPAILIMRLPKGIAEITVPRWMFHRIRMAWVGKLMGVCCSKVYRKYALSGAISSVLEIGQGRGMLLQFGR